MVEDSEQLALPGKQRKPKTKARIAARVKGMLAVLPSVVTEGVQPLNVGFFKLEAMRNRTVADAKLKSALRKAVKSKE